MSSERHLLMFKSMCVIAWIPAILNIYMHMYMLFYAGVLILKLGLIFNFCENKIIEAKH